MSGILGGFNLPPGLRGYVAAEQQGQQRQAQELGMLSQMANLQGVGMQQQEMQRKMAEAQERKGMLAQYAQQLPESERQPFMLSPEAYLKDKMTAYNLRPGEQRMRGGSVVAQAPEAAYTMSPGQTRMRGTEQIASMPANPSLVNVPIPGRPGIEQPTWLRPGETQGATVGGPRMPDILNPEVQAARAAVARAGKTSVTVNPMHDTFKDEQLLRKEYTSASESFGKLSEGYRKVKGALASDATTSAPATLAAATQFMKMLDPESVVRESELGMALNATGMWDRFTNIYNTVQHGGVLTPNQAKEFGRIADVVFEAASKSQQGRVQHFKGLAKSYNFDPERVVPAIGPQNRRASDAAQPRRYNPTTGTIE